MVHCVLCDHVLLSIKALEHHLIYIHGSKNLPSYRCRESQCHAQRVFNEFNSYKKHLINEHNIPRSNISPTEMETADYENPEQNTSEHDLGEPDNLSESSGAIPSDLAVFQQLIKHESLQFVSKLYADPSISRSVVNDVVQNTAAFLQSGILQLLGDDVLSSMEAAGVNPDIVKDVQSKFAMVENSFENLSTEHIRFKELKDAGSYIPPETYCVGFRLSEKRINDVVQYQSTPVKAQHIPLRHVLQQVFEMPSILQSTIEYMNSLNDNCSVLRNFIQGDLWKTKIIPFEGKIVLPLFIYCDDYEAGNPLGSHAGVHKMGAVYATVPCLPPSLQSKLQSIYLTLLFHFDDRKEFQNKAIFKPLIEELEFLYSNGIKVCTENGDMYFVLGLLIGDNLGLHSICGFVESFGANYACRFCKAPKTLRCKQLAEIPSLLRDRINYLEDLLASNVSTTGIKESCVWNTLPGFHVTENYAVDVMHDLFEGVLKYDFALMLKYFVLDKKIFSLNELNFMIKTFNYGPHEKCKPPAISEDNLTKGKLQFSAAEMLCLCRYFGVIVGEKVPRHDEVWQLYLTIRQIVDLVTTKCLQRSCHSLLDSLVAEHHAVYTEVLQETLKPKHHHMIHYGRCLLMSGPHSLTWCMRFESKHRPSKVVASVTTCRKNTPLTLAIRHQLELSSHLQSPSNKGIIVSGNAKIKVKDVLGQILVPDDFDDICLSPTSVTIDGTLYKQKTVIISDINDSGPVFAIISDIFISKNEVVYFLCHDMNNEGFDHHLYAYKVTTQTSRKLVKHVDLADPMAAWCVWLSSGDSYVVLRCSV